MKNKILPITIIMLLLAAGATFGKFVSGQKS
jgi:hypothetical protein